MQQEDTFSPGDETFVSHDDMSVMKLLLEQVKGLSFVSSAPALEFAELDESYESNVSFE